MTAQPTLGRRWSLRTRLILILAAVFVLLGGALIALTVSLAEGSVSRAYSASAPAAAELKKQINEILGQFQPTITKPPPLSKPTPSVVPSKPSQTPLPSGTAQSTPDTKQRLLAANGAYAALSRDTAVHDLILESVVAAAVLIPTAVLLAWLLVGRSLRPIRRISDTARRASANQLSERLALAGPKDEITELGDTFDAMMDRLEHAFDAQRRFIANASHELRTPLAVAGTAIDVVLAKPDRRPDQLEAMADDVRTALHRAERLVDGLLALTRSQHLDHPADAVDLAAIAEDVLDEQRPALAERSLTLDTRLADAPAVGDRVLLHRLVSNLVENAIRHNVDGGHIDVRTASSPDSATLQVTNTGPVIPTDQVPRLVEPFQRLHGRANSGESGLGLGLAIVHAVADAHGAHLILIASPTGGLTVTVELPIGANSRRGLDHGPELSISQTVTPS